MSDYEKHNISSAADEKPDPNSTSPSSALTSKAASAIVSSDEAIMKRARRKVDLFVLPLTILLYFLSFLDRSNIGNAKVAGFQKDVKLTNHEYSVGLTIFYVSYILIDIPSNLVTKKLGPNRHLPTLAFLWGLITIFQGTIKNYGGFVGARFCLGLIEGGLSPGVIFYLSSFYRREDMQLRMSLLYCATALAGGFSGLLAAAIQQMDGTLGHRGWQWIFYIEGGATMLLAIFIFLVMPASPATFKWFTPDENAAYNKALHGSWVEEDVGPINVRQGLSAFMDPQALFLAVITFTNGCMLAGLGYFSGPVIQNLGYSNTKTQLLTVPPFAVAAVVSITVAFLSDKYQQRGYAAASMSLCAVIGYAIFYTSTNKHTLYGSIFLQVIGVYATAPAIAAWITNNTWPHYKRGTMIGLGLMTTSCGSILSTWLFDDPPRYHKGTSINLALACAMCVCPLVTRFYYDRQNQTKAAIRASGQFDDSYESKKQLGDSHPSYIYAL
ncbi:hypothetical protein FRB94_003816 [Tulasnella sp. JGI-2019a]|nr:hypothetical protein FRB93_002759 [Tulasnella sp. JGI-2019a]KAG9002501.1 hypothetical protein FRB94_003816 [Tulasnella sp. JGI-2019a]